MGQLPADDAKHCELIKPDGSRCGGWKVDGSAYCVGHCENAEEIRQRAFATQRKNAELAEEFLSNYHKLQTSQDVINFIEKLINAVARGIIKDTAIVQRIAAPIPYLSSNIKAVGGQSGNGNNRGISATRTTTETVEYIFQTDEEMDEFLQSGDPARMVKMIEDLAAERAKKPPKPKSKAVDVEVRVIEPDLFSCLDEG